MDARTVADIEAWERRPFDGGTDGLYRLADAGFSGAVRAEDTYLFVVSGRPVGVFEHREDPSGETTTRAEIDAFEDASGVTFSAPHEALPLLYAMRATGGETRGRYYTNNTSIREVDRTLQEGGFTGYLELSENVLSGDYYIVYYGGERRSVAFVGQSRRLRTDDEAFDLAADEVGIYEVTAVDLPAVDLPERPDEPEEAGDVDTVAGAGAVSGAGGAVDDVVSGVDEEPNDVAVTADPDADEPSPSGSTPGSATAGTAGVDGTESDADATAEATADPDADTSGGTEPIDLVGAVTGADPSPEPPDPVDASNLAADEEDGPDADDAMAREDGDAGVESDADAEVDSTSDADGTPAEASQEDVEAAAAAVEAETAAVDATEADETAAHVVPSVDPDRTARAASVVEADAAESGASVDTDAGPAGAADPSSDDEVDGESAAIVDGETLTGLRQELTDRDREIERLQDRIASVTDERDVLRERVSALERRLEAAGAAPEGASRSLTPDEALAETNLFVRYASKRDATLSDAHGGDANRDAVRPNLRLEHHTQFETEGVEVDGRSFEGFLEDTQAYGFVRWLVEDLLFEIRDTGNAESMGALYDALPQLDRVEFGAEIEHEEGVATFDVVGRDRMGEPLLAADLEDVREPTDEATMGELVTDATAVAQSSENLACAFAVTASYFEPAALQTAREAAGGSLLSRDRRKSFVKLSRRRGFHLCLVEDREETFYLSVPEL